MSFFGNTRLKTTALALAWVALSACSELAVMVPVGRLVFKIESDPNLIMGKEASFSWSKNRRAQSFEVTVSTHADCSEPLYEQTDIKDTTVTLTDLNDGAYYFCAYARFAQRKAPASNNGLAFTIDRSDPVVKVPKIRPDYDGPFNPAISIDDRTDTEIVWSALSGPGQVSFKDSKSLEPQITASRNGTYEIKATVTDKAGNVIETIYTFTWTGGGKDEPAEGTDPSDNENDEGESGNSNLKFVSLVPRGVASDAWINGAEQSANGELWLLTAEGASEIKFTEALAGFDDDTLCDQTRSYSRATIPEAVDLTADDAYGICVELKDNLGAIVYGKAAAVERDIIPPTLQSLSRANAASDGLILADERFLVSPLFALSATAYANVRYSSVLDNSGNALACDASVLYDELQIASPSALAADGDYALCVQLTDDAGNMSYGKSESVVRDTSLPNLLTFDRINAASDAFINESERNSGLALWSITHSGASATAFTAPLDDGLGLITCDSSLSFSENTLPSALELASDGTWVVCARLTTANGNSTYHKSPSIVRDTVLPVFTSMARANQAADGTISQSESLSASALWTLAGSGYTQSAFAAAVDDSGGTLSCGSGNSYSLGSIPAANSLLIDGVYASCVRLSDAAGNQSYGKSETVSRITVGPTFTSLNGDGPASDGFINASEIASATPLWALLESGSTGITYTAALDDTDGLLECDEARTYSLSAIPLVTDLVADGAYSLCVRLVDGLGNVTFGKSQLIARGSSGPIFGSMLPIHEASDGYINDSEKALGSSLWVLSQSGGTSISYSLPLEDTAGTLACDASTSFTENTIPITTDLPHDGRWVLCVKLEDALSNVDYGKSSAITRDIVVPVFTSMALANAAADGFINESEKLLVSSMWSLTASSYTDVSYSSPADNAGNVLTCNGANDYSLNSIPSPSSLSVDGTFATCIELSDAAGNVSYGKSQSVVRDTSLPQFVSLNLQNGAADGFINDSEKGSALALAALVATNYSSVAYTNPLADASGTLSCDSSLTYGQAVIPALSSISVDGTFVICAELVSASGNKAYGKSASVVRDILPPAFTSLALTGAASDGFISYAERSGVTALWALNQTGASSISYTSPLDDSGASITCDQGQVYGEASIATASDLAGDDTWVICVTLADPAGNIAYGKSGSVVRSTVGPVFASLNRANASIDGYINDAEKALATALWALSASGHTSVAYTEALEDAGGSVACNQTQSYSQSNLETPADITSDGVYVVCAELTDSLGNISYGKSQAITRDVDFPDFTSLVRSNAASDGFINDGEKNSALALYALSATGYSAVLYTDPIEDAASTLVCDAGETYDENSIAPISSLSADGTYAICAALTDAAGNISYGKSQSVTRSTSVPTFTSLEAVNAASDNFINDSEKLLTNTMWAITANGHSAMAFTSALSDNASALVCDASQVYDQGAVPRPVDLNSDGAYSFCIRITDLAGNLSYGKGEQIVRDVVAPTLNSLLGANAASDLLVNDAEKASVNPLFTLDASGHSAVAYTIILDNAGGIVCDSSQAYGAASLPTIASLAADGEYALCVRLSDSAGNIFYGKSSVILRDTAAPVVTSFNAVNSASDGFVNNAEKLSTNPAWALVQTGGVDIHYTLALDDTGGLVSCTSGQTYGEASLPRIVDLPSDGTWVVCARLVDSSGNTSYGKSAPIERQTAGPSFGSLLLANAATDAFINDSEKLLVNAMWTLTATAYSSVSYTTALADAGGTLTCNISQTYGQSSIAVPSSLGADGPFALCVRLEDEAGNISYGKSLPLVRDTSSPSFVTLLGANEAADGAINDAEKNSNLALFVLSASGHSSASYTTALDDTGGLVNCTSSLTYGSGTIPFISSLTTDGTYATCVVLSDDAGNRTYGKSSQVQRDIVLPVFTSLVLANAATDGYINDSEKALTTALWTLSATGHTTAAYTSATDDAGSALVCNAGQNYNQASIALANSLGGDGIYSLCVRLSDNAGNLRYGKASPLQRDIASPSPATISINGGAAATSTTNATLSLAATDATAIQMYVTNVAGCASGGGWEAIAATKSWTLGQTNGTATVYVRYRDAAQNLSSCINDTILHAPAPVSTSVSIEAGASTVASTSVTLALTATGASEVYISNISGCESGGSWTAFATSKAWILSLGATSTATVFVKFRSAGMAESECISDTIGVVAPNRISNGNFESNALTPWDLSVANKWVVVSSNVNTGIYSAETNAPASNMNACLTQTANLSSYPEAHSLNFNIKYGTEPGWDFAEVFVDGLKKASYAGVSAWSAKSISVDGGASREIKFCYRKDGSGDHNGDFVSLDEIKLQGGVGLSPAPIDGVALNQKAKLNLSLRQGGVAERYLIIRGTSPVTEVPINGTTYSVGAFGASQVIYNNTSPTFMDTGLTNGVTYHYSVYAVRNTNHYSLATTTTVVPEVLHRPTTLATAINGSQLDLSWTVEAGGSQTGYLLVERTGSAPTFIPTQGVSYGVGGVTGGTVIYKGANLAYARASINFALTYYFQIWAYGAGNTYSLAATSASYQGCAGGLFKHGTCWFPSEVSGSCNDACSAKSMSFQGALYDALLSNQATAPGICEALNIDLGFSVSQISDTDEDYTSCEYFPGSGTSYYIYGGPSSGAVSWSGAQQICPCL